MGAGASVANAGPRESVSFDLQFPNNHEVLGLNAQNAIELSEDITTQLEELGNYRNQTLVITVHSPPRYVPNLGNLARAAQLFMRPNAVNEEIVPIRVEIITDADPRLVNQPIILGSLRDVFRSYGYRMIDANADDVVEIEDDDDDEDIGVQNVANNNNQPPPRMRIRLEERLVLAGGYTFSGTGPLAQRVKVPVTSTVAVNEDEDRTWEIYDRVHHNTYLSPATYIDDIRTANRIQVRVCTVAKQRELPPQPTVVYQHRFKKDEYFVIGDYKIVAYIPRTPTSFLIIYQETFDRCGTVMINDTRADRQERRASKPLRGLPLDFFTTDAAGNFINDDEILIVRTLPDLSPRASIYNVRTNVDRPIDFPGNWLWYQIKSLRVANHVFITDGRNVIAYDCDNTKRFTPLMRLKRDFTYGFTIGRYGFSAVLVTGGHKKLVDTDEDVEYEMRDEIFYLFSMESQLRTITSRPRVHGFAVRTLVSIAN
jgi:hypothetical protein